MGKIKICSFVPHEEGDYQVCFDNGVSSYYGKTIFFAFDLAGDDDDDEEDEDEDYWKKLVSDEFKQVNEYDGKVNDFKVSHSQYLFMPRNHI